jgi:hypothetical protein
MRFMMIVKASKKSEAGIIPSDELIAAMTKYNEELVKAGALLDASGLQPSSKAARVKFSGEKRNVIDGPFAETKELIAGYWIIKADSLAGAIAWATRAPNPSGNEESEIEIRQFFEMEDFAPSPTVERAFELGKDIAKSKKQAQ